ncbi:FIST C-terminal domain-containing protein [Patescibacteria group bacterium]|nr:FIST C-terminal domain-containing protein [Patescibacteria group bacterium]MDE1944230.1 FIST C-terminal domain-containing protein [Patescibacteria group bacterium]MDE1945165.1 FIST C-terminal domain-containing protein [Patescibacteria group bacterium]
MAFSAGVGTSRALQDSKTAGHDAAAKALAASGAAAAGLAVVVASPKYDQAAMLQGVAEALPGARIVGCTSAGAITENGVEEQAVSVLALAGEAGAFVPVKVEGIGKDMRGAGKRFGEALKAAGGEMKLALIFSDALAGNGTELVRGILEVMGGSFPIAGGAAGDDMAFKKTEQYFDTEVLTDAVVGFGLAGDVQVAVGADHGWQPLGDAHTVTKAEGTKLIELDGKPAFSIYQDYFGDRANDFKQALSLQAVTYPLGMKSPGAEGVMIRVPLAVGEDGSITCGAEVLEGSQIFLMIGTLTSAMDAAKATAEKLVERVVDAKPRVVFVSDCIARKILFGEHAADEVTLLKSIGGPKSVIFGLYTYGQIATLDPAPKDINTCDPGFYEQSISITVFGS